LIQKIVYRGTTPGETNGTFSFKINNDACSEKGTKSYMAMSTRKTAPEAAVAIIHINDTSTAGACAGHPKYEYDLVMTLEGAVDFIYTTLENVKIT
jgi:hypothetical protein